MTTYLNRPAPQIDTLEDLVRHVEEELRQIALSLAEVQEVELRARNAPPTKPRDGMIVYADGVVWNPGAGAGVYGRVAGAWVKL